MMDEHKNKNKNKKKSTEVKIYSLNVNSLRAEKGERLKKLAARVALFQPHAVLVQETKLNESIPDSQVAIPGYRIYRFDRTNNDGGGGVAIYVRNDLNVVGDPITGQSNHDDVPSIEAITVNVEINREVVAITSTYRPPIQTEAAISEYTRGLLLHCVDHPARYRVVGGDFNCCHNATRRAEALPSCQLFCLLELQPTVYKPTHNERIIDQVFIPESAELIGRPVLDVPIEREHCPVFVRFRVTDDDSSSEESDGEDRDELVDKRKREKCLEGIEKLTDEEYRKKRVQTYMELVRNMINQCAQSLMSGVTGALNAIYCHIKEKCSMTGAVTGTIVGGATGGIGGVLMAGPHGIMIGVISGALIGLAPGGVFGGWARNAGWGVAGELGGGVLGGFVGGVVGTGIVALVAPAPVAAPVRARVLAAKAPPPTSPWTEPLMDFEKRKWTLYLVFAVYIVYMAADVATDIYCPAVKPAKSVFKIFLDLVPA